MSWVTLVARALIPGVALLLGLIATDAVRAAGGAVPGPTAKAPDHYGDYPGTESLVPDKMRVTACGTGMPAVRHEDAINRGKSMIDVLRSILGV